MEILNPYKNIEELTGLLVQANLKVTTTRLTVLNILKNEQRELTAAEILYNPSPQVKKLSFAGVYQTLKQLEEAGLLVKFKFRNEQALYSLKDYQGNIRICCKKCGQLQSIQDQALQCHLQTLLSTHDVSTYHLTLEKSECVYCKH